MAVASAAMMGLQMLGGIGQGNSQRAAGKYNAAIANQNAQLQDIQAQDSLQRGAQKADRYQQQTQQLLGHQRTEIAANNIDPSSGSALDILTSTAGTRSRDESNIRANAARQAYGHRTKAVSLRSQGRYDRYMGKQKQASSILGGLTSAASTGFSAYKSGAFG